MKRYLVILLVFFTLPTLAQRYAFVDTDYVLSKIPSYKAAQEELNTFSKKWQKEIEGLYDEIENLKKDFQAEKILLTDDMKKQRAENIKIKEKDVKELQRKYFGPEGELFEKRQELIQPIQDEVYNAIKDLSEDSNYSAIFDISSEGFSILYYNPKLDKSDDILERLGYKN